LKVVRIVLCKGVSASLTEPDARSASTLDVTRMSKKQVFAALMVRLESAVSTRVVQRLLSKVDGVFLMEPRRSFALLRSVASRPF